LNRLGPVWGSIHRLASRTLTTRLFPRLIAFAVRARTLH
jgi:hypothetical protein